MGLEGVVAKRVASRHRPGARTAQWRKIKHRSVEWLDLVGWRRPAGRHPGRLVVAENGRVVAVAFPGLAGAERRRFADLVASHGTEASDGVDLPGRPGRGGGRLP